MHGFFKELFLQDSAIFVLYGSKPMVCIDVSYMTPEECQKEVAKMSEEERKRLVFANYDFPENWAKWKEIENHFPVRRYMLFSYVSHVDDSFDKLFLVDKVKTAQVIEEHYELFRRRMGYDFDPFEKVLSMRDREDPFWKKIFTEDSVLFGILMGFGAKNAWAFDWRSRWYIEGIEEYSMITGKSFSHCDGAKKGRLTFGGKPVSERHFPIPVFVSFSDSGKDPVEEQYKKEREEIKKLLKKKGLVDLVLEKLCS